MRRVVRRAFLASSLATLASPMVLRWARADTPPVTLKLHHSFSAVSSVHDKFLAPWARKVEADANGRLRIDIFPSMELGGAPAALFDQARDGDADIVWTAPGLTPGRCPKIETFELPFLPSRRALVSSKALQDFAATDLKDEFDEVHPLAFSCADRSVIHTYAPVRSIEDIKGAKLHVQTRLAGEAMRVLGAHPVPMPSVELPVAITQRVVDGCIDPWHMVPPLRLNDLLKAHTEFSDLSLSSRTYVLAMNKAAYDRLPRELKTALDANSGQVAAGMAGTMWDLQARAVADDVAERGDVIVTLLPEAVTHWRKETEPVVTAWLKDMKEQKVDGAKLIASARALLAKYANLPEPQPPQPLAPPEPTPAAEPPPRSAGVTTVPQVNATPQVSTTPPMTTAPPSPVARPAPSPAPAPAPHVATPAASAPKPPMAKPAPPATAAVSAPVPKPVPAPPTAAAPVMKPVPPPPPPAPAPVPAAPPKTLDIPL
jgi:TRAP-type C4-dicarboxylate transport system substrate-binding protein